jgi:hypothetical protein
MMGVSLPPPLFFSFITCCTAFNYLNTCNGYNSSNIRSFWGSTLFSAEDLSGPQDTSPRPLTPPKYLVWTQGLTKGRHFLFLTRCQIVTHLIKSDNSLVSDRGKIEIYLRGYHTLQGDNSLKSVEHFDHMMFVCRFQAFRWSKPQGKKLICG